MKQVIALSDRSFSLTLALHDIAHRVDCELAVDDLHALLGLSMLVCAPTDRYGGVSWSLLGRDVALVEAALAMGVTVRGIHPPEAAHNLSDAAEFGQHFKDSYLPLVERALENDQPVLAWQGWSDAQSGLWGRVTDTTPAGVGLLGQPFPSSNSDKSPNIALTRPPVQLYVIETVSLTPQPKNALLGAALENALLAHGPARMRRFGITAGVAAYDMILESVDTDSHDRSLLRLHEFAASIAAGHAAALRFLSPRRETGHNSLDVIVASLIDAGQNITRTFHNLTPDALPSKIRDWLRFAQQQTAAIIKALNG